jgi:hypothetical protein
MSKLGFLLLTIYGAAVYELYQSNMDIIETKGGVKYFFVFKITVCICKIKNISLCKHTNLIRLYIMG